MPVVNIGSRGRAVMPQHSGTAGDGGHPPVTDY
jgi:hypothetical protein